MEIFTGFLYVVNTKILVDGIIGIFLVILTTAVSSDDKDDFFTFAFMFTVLWVTMGVLVNPLFVLVSGIMFVMTLFGKEGFSSRGDLVRDIVKFGNRNRKKPVVWGKASFPSSPYAYTPPKVEDLPPEVFTNQKKDDKDPYKADSKTIPAAIWDSEKGKWVRLN